MLGEFVALFGDELRVVGDEFAVGAFGDDEAFVFEFLKGFLHGIGIDFGKNGKVADGWQALSGRDFAGNNIEFELFDELNIDWAIIVKIELHIIVLVI